MVVARPASERGGPGAVPDAARPALRLLLWHVHGSWTSALVRGEHTYLLPTVPEGGRWGRGRAGRDWPERTAEIPASALRDTDVDVVVLQRPEEPRLAADWLGRVPGRDVPAVYVEHNTPPAPGTRHPLADQDTVPIVHVTYFNELMWDCGRAPTRVIEHGVVDPGHRYTGELDHAAIVANDPVRRFRVTGTDLWPSFAAAAHLDAFGMGLDGVHERVGLDVEALTLLGDLRTEDLHAAMARRRVYVHPVRWTSLGLSLIEAMHLGMPVVALAATEVVRAVPGNAGVISTRVPDLVAAVRELRAEPALARQMGERAREAALRRYGLTRFLADWDAVLREAVRAA